MKRKIPHNALKYKGFHGTGKGIKIVAAIVVSSERIRIFNVFSDKKSMPDRQVFTIIVIIYSFIGDVVFEIFTVEQNL